MLSSVNRIEKLSYFSLEEVVAVALSKDLGFFTVNKYFVHFASLENSN